MDTLSIRHSDDLGAFALEGELDMASGEELLKRLQVAPSDRDLVLDCSGLVFMDSSGLRAILEAAATRNHGSHVVLKDPTQAVSRVLEIALPGGAPGIKLEWSHGGSNDERGSHVSR